MSTSSVFQPFIPSDLLTDADRQVIEAFGITIDTTYQDNKVFLYCDLLCINGVLKGAGIDGTDMELDEDDLYMVFQEIIRRSNGKLKWISKEIGYYDLEHLDAGSFGGGAVFVTADDVQCVFTGDWLEEHIRKAENGNGLADGDKTILGIVIANGGVSNVVSDHPERFKNVNVAIIDYDTDGADEDCLTDVPEISGASEMAHVSLQPITDTIIDLPRLMKKVNQ